MERGGTPGGCQTGAVGEHHLHTFTQNHELISEEIRLPIASRPKTRCCSSNDEKSEKSVRDKIAMFSDQSASSISASHAHNGRKVPVREIIRPTKAPPSPPVKRDKNITIAKIADQPKSKEVDMKSTDVIIHSLPHSQESSTLPRPERNTVSGLTRAVSFTGGTKLHSRSQSLVDIGNRTSFRLDDSRRLSSIIEHRRKCISKLKGLVIPEKVAEVPHFIDLPEIKSRDCPLPLSPPEKFENQSAVTEGMTSETPLPGKSINAPLIPSPPWKSADAGLPKYSPAFKRKSLTVYGINHNGAVSSWLGSNQVTDQSSDHYLDIAPSKVNSKSKVLTSPVHSKGTDVKDEESDNDSAVSSSRSDLSHSPTNDVNRFFVSRTHSSETNPSTETTVTSRSITTTVQQSIIANNSLTENNIRSPPNFDVQKNKHINTQVSPFKDQLKVKPGSDEINDTKRTQDKKLLVNNNHNDISTRMTTSAVDNHLTFADQNKIKQAKHPLPIFKNNNYNCHNNNFSNNSIKNHFEKTEVQVKINNNVQHPRVSSIDSTTSDDSLFPATSTHYGSITNLQREQQFGSITSLASSTSLISQQELSQLIEEANHTLEESHEVVVVILHRDNPGGSIGITLAGGADCEAKEITVHKVLVGSPAERDGRIQKGDRILSINGKSMKGLTHYESLAILKAPRPEVVLVVSRHKSDSQEETSRCQLNLVRSPRFIDQHKYSNLPPTKDNEMKWGPIETVNLHKDGTGLGFSLEGGKDSLYGDMPLTIKKIFTGGCAEKCGLVSAGDELLSVNGHDFSGLSRIEAWALMKKLPDGKVTLTIRHPLA